MKRIKHLGKRYLSALLALFMLLSCCKDCFLQLALAATAGAVTVTDGQLLVKQYSLSESLQTLLQSQLLQENSYTYHVPSESDDLVEIDPDNRKISARSYSRNGFVWVPTRANVINGQENEAVALTEEGGVYVGSFRTLGNTYSVSVTYALHISVAEQQQEVLLNAGANIKHALNQIEIIAAQQGRMETFATYIDKLMELVNGVPTPWGGTIQYEDSSGAVRNLYNQKVANGGEFDLVKMIREYYAISGEFGKTKYLVDNGEEFYNTAVETGAYLQGLCKDRSVIEALANLASGLMDTGVDPALLKAAFDNLQIAGDTIVEATTLKWEVLDHKPIRTELSKEAHLRLDALVQQVEAAKPNVTIQENLLAHTTAIQVNMNRFNITVKYVAKVVDRNQVDTDALTTLENRQTALITLNAGAGYEEIMAAVAANDMENRVLADWEIYQVGTANYDRVVTGISQSETLDSDITLTVIYTPKTYTLTGVEGIPAQVPYGYNLRLPAHSEKELEYDYTVGGTFYRQNTVYRVTGNTVLSRTEGAPWEDLSWGSAISVGMSPEAAAVLSSNALNTGTLSLRRPGSDWVKISTAGAKYAVTAPNAPSGVTGLEWIAVGAWVVTGDEKVPVEDFADGRGSFSSTGFDKVEVAYRLRLNDATDTAGMLYLVNLPHGLTTQATDQKAAMSLLLSRKDSLGQFGTYASFLTNLLSDERVGETSATALTTIMENCINKTGPKQQLFLYEYLLGYEEKGLVWYYTHGNYEKINSQFTLLRTQLGVFIDNTPALLDIMKEYLDGIKPGMAEDYYGKIDEIRNTLEEITLIPPHEAIDRTAGELELKALVDAVEGATGKVGAYSEAPEILLSDTKEAAALDKLFVTLRLRVEEGKTLTVSMNFPMFHVLTQDDIRQLQQRLDELMQQLEIPEQYYIYSGDVMPEAGTQLTGSLTLTHTWALKQIPVYVDGETQPLGSFTLKKPYLVLPACTTAGFRYHYIINGKDYPTFDTSLSVTLSAQEMEYLRQGGKIVRQTIDIARRDVLDFVAALNNALADTGAISGASFIPVEDAQGKLTVILKLSPNVTGYNGKNVLSAVAQAVLMNSKFAYVDLGGHPLREDTKIHLQGIFDALLESNFSLKVMENAIHADGTVSNMVLPGNQVIAEELQLGNGNFIPNTDTYGAKLIETTLDLAANATVEPTQVKLYITLGDDGTHTQELQQVKTGLAQLTQYVDVHLAGGSANLVLTLTEQTYQKFLTAMLLSDNAQLSNMNQLDYGLCVEYLYELIEPLLTDDSISTDTLENTAQSSGQTLDLSAARDALKSLQDVLRYLDENVEYSNSHAVGNLYTTDAKMEANILLDELSIPDGLRSMIAENNGHLTATFGIQLTNVDNHYQALVIDREKPANQRVEYVADLFEAMNQIHDNGVVILLDHVVGDISTDKKIYLDLNGKTVTGNVSGDRMVLVDSTIENRGQITGTVSRQVKDRRISDLYTVQVVNRDIQVSLNATLLTADRNNSLSDAAATLAMDLIFNFYTSAALKLDSQVIYGLNVDDLVSILEDGGRPDGSIFPQSLKLDGLNHLLSKMFADLTDYKGLERAVAEGKVLAQYDLATTAWNFTLTHDTQRDVLEGTFGPAKTEKANTLSIYLGGTAEEKLAAQAALKALAQAVNTEIRVEIQELLPQQDEMHITGSGEMSVTFYGGKNPDYTLSLAAVLASRRADKGQLVAALETWFETADAAALKMVVDNTTVAQLFDAICSIQPNTDMAALAEGLGMERAYLSQLQQKLEDNKALLVYLSNQLSRMQVAGTAEKVSAYEVAETYGVYDFSPVLKNAARLSIMGGTLQFNALLRVELFNNDPSFEDGRLQINVDGSVILGSKLDTENRIIYLDTVDEGITVEQFNMQVVHGATNATQVKGDFAESTPDRKGVVLRNGKYYVVNGAKVTFCASNNSSTTVAKTEYTVVLVGDVNSDGIINVSDAVALSNHIVGNLDLSKIFGQEALLAANLDNNITINVADVVRIAYKCVDNYTSVMK